MTDGLSQVISSKNSSVLHEKNNSSVLVNSETNGTTFWSYFETKMSEIKSKITPDSTVNSILTQYIDEHKWEGTKNLIF